jgi:hypothetical protein
MWCGSGSGMEAGAAEGQVSQWYLYLQPERWGSHPAWVWCMAMTLCSLRGREPSKTEQICRPTRWIFGGWLFFY